MILLRMSVLSIKKYGYNKAVALSRSRGGVATKVILLAAPVPGHRAASGDVEIINVCVNRSRNGSDMAVPVRVGDLRGRNKLFAGRAQPLCCAVRFAVTVKRGSRVQRPE